MRPITMTYSSSLSPKIDRKCEYDQQPTGNSAHRFALYAEDLMLLCDKELPNSCKMNISGALPPRIITVSTVAEKQTSESNLAAPSVPRYQGCHLIWAAHQEWRTQVHLATRDALDCGLIKCDG